MTVCFEMCLHTIDYLSVDIYSKPPEIFFFDFNHSTLICWFKIMFTVWIWIWRLKSNKVRAWKVFQNEINTYIEILDSIKKPHMSTKINSFKRPDHKSQRTNYFESKIWSSFGFTQNKFKRLAEISSIGIFYLYKRTECTLLCEIFIFRSCMRLWHVLYHHFLHINLEENFVLLVFILCIDR